MSVSRHQFIAKCIIPNKWQYSVLQEGLVAMVLRLWLVQWECVSQSGSELYRAYCNSYSQVFTHESGSLQRLLHTS